MNERAVVQEEGKYLMVGVTVLAVAALAILGLASKNESSNADREKRKAGGHKPGAKPSLQAGGKSRASDSQAMEGGAEELLQGRLLIPPPDEPRIEAVAPKNERRGLL